MQRIAIRLLMLVLLVPLCIWRADAQSTEGRWLIGFHGGPNMWISDFDDLRIGIGGDILIRYGFTRNFSLGLMGGYEVLKTHNSSPVPEYNSYDYMKLNAIPLSLLLHFHVAPGKSFSPYFYVGGGLMMYKRQAHNSIYYPDDKLRSSYLIPIGMGFDAFVSRNIAFSMMVGFSNFDQSLDLKDAGSINGNLTAKVGLNFYLGSSDLDDEDEDGLTNGEERRMGTDPETADTDGDGLTDGDEVLRYRTNPLIVDTDGDGLTDGDEVKLYRTDPTKFDTDVDGLSDGDEALKHKTDPTKPDTDGDGLTDGEEVLKLKTDPLRVDSDGDALSDWDEVRVYRTNPLLADTDGDVVKDGDEVKKIHTDPLKADTDGGGANDGVEVQRGTSPLDPKDDFGKDTMVLQHGRSILLEGVNFETGSSKLSRQSEKTLEKAFVALIAAPEAKVEIAGYTDNVGNAQRNRDLSQRRADAVKTWLVKKGIDSSRLTAVGYGIQNPISTNLTPDGRAKNRRIEFHVK